MRLLLGVLLAFAATCAAAQELRPWSGPLMLPLTLRDLDGKEHRLQDYRGKVVLINFWATWCEPCREEIPSMNSLRAALGAQPFVVLAVNLGEPASRIRNFMEKLPMDFPVLLDADRSVAKAWQARLLPASYLVGPDGRLRYSVLGGIDWMAEPARKTIRELLPPAGK